MKALFIKDGGDMHIELISENADERAQLLKHWEFESMAVSCEEWREQVPTE